MPRRKVRAAPKRKTKKQKDEDVSSGDDCEHDAPLNKQEKQERLNTFLTDFDAEMEERQAWLREQYEEQIRDVSMLFDLEIAKYPEHVRKMKITDFFSQLEKDNCEEKQKIPTVYIETAENEENKENMSEIGQKKTETSGGSRSLAPGRAGPAAAITTPATTDLSDLISLLNMTAQRRSVAGSKENDLPPLTETDAEGLRNHLGRCYDTLGVWVEKSTQARTRRRRQRH